MFRAGRRTLLFVARLLFHVFDNVIVLRRFDSRFIDLKKFKALNNVSKKKLACNKVEVIVDVSLYSPK